MKALSLHQPWASWTADGSKTIETRVWKTKYRGELLIVSTQRPKLAGYPAGQALCIATLVDCRPMTRDDEPKAVCPYYPGRWSWVLENIRPIEPFAVRGRRRIYDVGDVVINQKAIEWV